MLIRSDEIKVRFIPVFSSKKNYFCPMQLKGDFEKASVGELVSENYVFAAVLHYFGISFYQYQTDSSRKFVKSIKSIPDSLFPN